MVIKCAVIGCESHSKFKFPKNQKIRKKWLKAIRRPDFQPKHRHLQTEDIAVQSVFSGEYYNRILANNEKKSGVHSHKKVTRLEI